MNHEVQGFEMYNNKQGAQPPDVFQLVVPLSEGDITGGKLESAFKHLHACRGLRHLSVESAREFFAKAMGYTNWQGMLQRKGHPILSGREMPMQELRLYDVIAWRLFLAGACGLCDAICAVQIALESSKLEFRQLYGPFGSLNKAASQLDSRLSRRPVVFPEATYRQWSLIELMPSGNLRLKYRAEAGYSVASHCWSPVCGISKDELLEEIYRDAEVSIEDAIQTSWFQACWPHGLSPVEFHRPGGSFLGYGWRWTEIGGMLTRVFETKEALMQSAIALWKGLSTAPFAMERLPAYVVEVSFVNPWDSRDRSAVFSEDVQRDIDAERTPFENVHLDVIAVREHKLALGREVDVTGDIWTMKPFVIPGSPNAGVEGVLGLKLPTLEEIGEDVDGWRWMAEKVPYAFAVETFELFVRTTEAFDAVSEAADGKRADPKWVKAVTQLLGTTAVVATPVASHVCVEQLLSSTGHMLAEEVKGAGSRLAKLYPELGELSVDLAGDYALAFYGKNGLRAGAAFEARDAMFMAYAVMRNLGLDPELDLGRNWLGIFDLALNVMQGKSVEWFHTQEKRDLVENIRLLVKAAVFCSNFRDEVDGSLERSRLGQFGLVQS